MILNLTWTTFLREGENAIRQKNRTKNTKILNVEPLKQFILEAIKKTEGKKTQKISNFSYEDNSAKKFYDLLTDEKIWNISHQKQFIDKE